MIAGDRGDGVRLDPDRDRGAAPRGEPHQAAPPALQRAPPRRQVVPLHPDHRRTTLPRRSSSIAARGAGRAPISGRSPRPARSAARSIRCSAPSCIRTCSDSFYESRTRPCLLYQIKRCSAPCTGVISHSDYAPSRRRGEGLPVRHGARRCATEMPREMETAAERLDFEAAAVYRDRLAALSHIQGTRASIRAASRRPTSSPATRRAAQTCIEVFFFRTGQNWGNRAYFPRADTSLDCAGGARLVPGAVLRRQAGAEADPALATTIEERELLDEALSEKSGHRVEIAGAAARREEGPRRARARPMRARRSAASSPSRHRRRRCSPASPSASASPSRRGGSRSTTTATSWAPTRSAR